MKTLNPKSNINRRTNSTHINDATVATKKLHFNMASNNFKSIHMYCSIHTI
jgi:DNA-binding ferritin-like protein